ncbi:MAG: hypothetical protein KKE23_04505 [Nanoarchaeota archaeon]|nr:hypothetical protein [Nanoarchaeota archaeon]
MNDFNIFSNPRKSRYDPDLARRVNEEKEPAIIRKEKLEAPKVQNLQKSDLKGFIYVPSINLYLAKERTLKGKSWNETHKILQEDNKFMPSIYQFTEYLKYLQNDHRDKTEAKEILDDILKKTQSGWKGEWLDAKFEKRNKGLYLLSEHKIQNGKLIAKSEQPLEKCVTEDCYVDLKFNNQGLPISKSKSQSYNQGKNVYFWQPVDGRVAGFNVGSGRADLYCSNDDPDGRYVGLGVFPCAEGASQKI